jgi:hypothetical protein
MVTEQIKGIEAKVQEQLKDAQAKAATRAKEIEAEARKAVTVLSEKAQVWLGQAEATSREGLSVLGAELVKIGKKLQDFGKQVEAKVEKKAEEPAPSAEA